MHVAASPAPPRVLSIDVLRGLTVALMILVNDPGDWSHVYRQLDHSAWNGCTLTDLVFPTFLFLVGASTILSTSARLARGVARSTIARSVLRRAATIFALDLVFAALPYFHLGELRIFGVLTRIALCYLFTGLLTLTTRRIVPLLVLSAGFLVGYWVLLRFVPVPGLGTPGVDFPLLDPDRNLAAWTDRSFIAFLQRTVHTGRLYERTRDPEGLLSTLPAIATTLIGAASAIWLRHGRELDLPAAPSARHRSQAPRESKHLTPSDDLWMPRTEEQRRDGLLAFGLLNLFLGVVWNHWFPMNKKLWTSSYVLFAAGSTIICLTLLYWIYDVRHLDTRSRLLRAIRRPAVIFGVNAITAYAVSELLAELMMFLKLPAGNLPSLNTAPMPPRISASLWTYRHLFALHQSTSLSSALFACAVVAVCFIPNYVLWRKGVSLKV